MARRGTSPVLFLMFGLVAALAAQSGVGSLPVAAQSASPVAATEETLLELTIPPELLPQGERITSDLVYVTSPPGSTGIWQEIDGGDWPGLRIHYVLDGSLRVRAEGAAQVVRVGERSTLEDVPAGMEVGLGPGDAWIARNEIPFEAVNASAAPAHLLMWVAANIEDPKEFNLLPGPGTWFLDDEDALPPGVVMPAGPARLRIRLLELPVEGRLPSAPGAIQHAVRPPTNAAGTPVVDPSLGTLRNGTVVNIGRKPVTAYVLSLEPLEAEMSTPAAGTPES